MPSTADQATGDIVRDSWWLRTAYDSVDVGALEQLFALSSEVAIWFSVEGIRLAMISDSITALIDDQSNSEEQ